MLFSVNYYVGRLKTCSMVFCSQSFGLHGLDLVTYITVYSTEFIVTLAEMQKDKTQSKTEDLWAEYLWALGIMKQWGQQPCQY